MSKKRLNCASNVQRTLRRARQLEMEIIAMRRLGAFAAVCELVDVVQTIEHVHIVMELGGGDLYE